MPVYKVSFYTEGDRKTINAMEKERNARTGFVFEHDHFGSNMAGGLQREHEVGRPIGRTIKSSKQEMLTASDKSSEHCNWRSKCFCFRFFIDSVELSSKWNLKWCETSNCQAGGGGSGSGRGAPSLAHVLGHQAKARSSNGARLTLAR